MTAQATPFEVDALDPTLYVRGVAHDVFRWMRENDPVLGNLLADFDFTRPPRPPLLLPTRPATDAVEPIGKAPYSPQL